MAAIVVCSTPRSEKREHPDFTFDPADWMPFSTRLLVARELNKLWEEFVTEMHDGSTSGPEVADKFWKFVTTRGRPS